MQFDLNTPLVYIIFPFSEHNFWIPASEPNTPKQPSFHITSTKSLSNSQKEYEFSLSGPSALHVYFAPLPGVELMAWSFADEIFSTYTWKGQPVYFIHYVQGLLEYQYQTRTFSLTFEIPDNWTEPYHFDISFGAHFIHQEETKTQEFIDFTQAFPKWANVQNWTAYHISKQF